MELNIYSGPIANVVVTTSEHGVNVVQEIDSSMFFLSVTPNPAGVQKKKKKKKSNQRIKPSVLKSEKINRSFFKKHSFKYQIIILSNT